MAKFGVTAEVDANTSGFHRAMDGVGRRVDGMKRRFRGLRGVMGAALGAAGVGAFLGRVDQRNMAVESLSLTTGMDTRSAQFMNFLAERSGMEGRDMSGVLRDISERQRDALAGSEGLQAAFANLGITMDDLERKKPGELFRDIFRAIETAEGPAEISRRLVNVTEITSDEVAERMAPLMRRGMARMLEEFAESGHMVSEEQMQREIETGRDVRRFGRFAEGLGRSAIAATYNLPGNIAEFANRNVTERGGIDTEGIGLEAQGVLLSMKESLESIDRKTDTPQP